MAQRLTHLKHKCFEADDGLQALTLVRQSDIADGATQMRLAGFDGPIIGITGDDDNGGFLDAGADVVLVKPVLPEAILEAIADATTQQSADAPSAAKTAPQTSLVFRR